MLFGRKLPDIGRSLGKTMVEFKKGMKGIEDEVSEAVQPRAAIEPEPVKAPQRVTPSTPTEVRRRPGRRERPAEGVKRSDANLDAGAGSFMTTVAAREHRRVRTGD